MTNVDAMIIVSIIFIFGIAIYARETAKVRHQIKNVMVAFRVSYREAVDSSSSSYIFFNNHVIRIYKPNHSLEPTANITMNGKEFLSSYTARVLCTALMEEGLFVQSNVELSNSGGYRAQVYGRLRGRSEIDKEALESFL